MVVRITNSQMKKVASYFLLISAVTLLMVRCYYDNEEALYPSVDLAAGGDTITVTFQADIIPILQTYCSECHSSSNAASKGNSLVLDSYSNVSSVVTNGSFYGSISWDPAFVRMPYRTAKLPSAEIFKVKKWIDDGAPDN